ncbi:MAG: cyclic nucleotide-binding domain-containing protein [Desulfobacterales bacterium]|nr:cyclic nucleotide-binding domain-containing protein [Desulfobacterales bacterium]
MSERDTVRGNINKIRKIPLFSYLTDSEVDKILHVSKVASFKDGEVLISEGDSSQHIFAVVEGKVRVSLSEFDGEDMLISTMAEGEVFGEAAIFMAEKRTATVTSLGDSTIIRIHRKDVMAFIRSDPMAGNKILMIIIYGLLKKLRETNQDRALGKQLSMNLDDFDSLIQNFLQNI